MSARVAKLCECKACRSRRAKARKWCDYIIDSDATVNDAPHQTIYCGTRLEPGATRCPKHVESPRPLNQGGETDEPIERN